MNKKYLCTILVVLTILIGVGLLKKHMSNKGLYFTKQACEKAIQETLLRGNIAPGTRCEDEGFLWKINWYSNKTNLDA